MVIFGFRMQERSELVQIVTFFSVKTDVVWGGHARRIYSFSVLKLCFVVVSCRLVQEGDILCVPTFGHAEFLDVNADKFLR